MQLIILLLVLLISPAAHAQTDSMSKDDYKLGQKYGYSKRDLKDAHQEAKNSFNRDLVIKQVAQALEKDPVSAAQLTDLAIENMLSTASVFMRAEGHHDVADEIETEYRLYYRGSVTALALGIKEIGDHPPLSQWLESVHKKIHDTIGDFLCKQIHIHDIWILNYSIPVVFSPEAYTQKDYLDHFAGHLIWGWFWEHHGFAGVVTYWVVNGVCIGATYGLGIVTFVCGPIASFAENVMDKRIAPGMGVRIWERAQQGQ